MLKVHNDRSLYFEQQYANTKKYIVSFVNEVYKLKPGMEVLEIGCGEGGVLKAFVDTGMKGVGVDLHTFKFNLALDYLDEYIKDGRIELINNDIYSSELQDQFKGRFDLIILKDTLEHIFDQDKLIGYLKGFLKKGGMIFLAFPPWCMPFGGHQQMCSNKLLANMPWYHLLPTPVYSSLLKAFKEDKQLVNELINIKETRISLQRYHRIVKNKGFRTIREELYFINPNYEIKFNMKPRLLNKFIGSIPYLRDFMTTTIYSLIQIEAN
jgi:2-polyprenyl-3-methyl-5-hydroxy-6-metoxy-1,4-benzoquinol methylase